MSVFGVFLGAQANTLKHYSQAILSSNILSFWFLRARTSALLRAQTLISRFDFWGFGFGFLRAHTMVLHFGLVLRALLLHDIPRIRGFFFHSTRSPRS